MECEAPASAKNPLVDLNEITIDHAKPVPERILEFVSRIKDPYLFRVGELRVAVSFAENGDTLQQTVERLLLKPSKP